MRLSTTGLVIKEKKINENDIILSILTPENGVVFARIKGAKSFKNKMNSSTEFLTYSKFELFKKNDAYIVDYAEVLEFFYSLRCDLKKLSLGSYFAQLTYFLTKQDTSSESILKLLLNTLYLLEKGKKKPEFLKPVFELRSLSISGFMPDLICCSECSENNLTIMNFNILGGNIKCDNCVFENEKEIYRKLSPDIFGAMRHIIYSESAKLFNFNLNEKNLKNLGYITENYMKSQLEINIPTLKFYKSL